MNRTELIQNIQENITDNDNGLITAQVMRNVLGNIVNEDLAEGLGDAEDMPISQKAVTGIALDIDNKLTELEQIPIDLSGYFLNANIGQLTAFIEDANLKSCKFSVAEGFVVEVKGKGSNTARLWATLDADGIVVRCADFIDAHHSEEVVIESGECSLIYSSYDAGELYVKLKYLAYNATKIAQEVSKLNAKIESNVINLESKIEEIYPNLNGYYLNSTIGQKPIFIDDANLKSCQFAVTEGEVLEVKGRGSATARLWATLDADGIVVRCADFIDAHHSEEVVVESGEHSVIYTSYATSGELYVKVKSSIADFSSKKTAEIVEEIVKLENTNKDIVVVNTEFIQGETFNHTLPVGKDKYYVYIIVQADEELNSLFLQLNFDGREITYIQPNKPLLFKIENINNLNITRDGGGITLAGNARIVVAYNASAIAYRAMKSPIFVDSSRFVNGYLFSDGNVLSDDNYRTSPFIPVRIDEMVEISHLYTSNYGTIYFYGDRFNLLDMESTPHPDAVLSSYVTYIRENNVRYIRYTCLAGQLAETDVNYVNCPFPADTLKIIAEQQENYNKVCYGKNKKLFGSADDSPIITIIDDDTVSADEVTRFFNACNNKGIKGTYAVLTDAWERDDQIKDLLLQYERTGFGMALHSYSQNNAYLEENVEEAGADLIRGMQDMQSAGFIDYKHWVTPFGVSNEIWKNLAIKVGMECLVSIGQNAVETNDFVAGRFGLMRPNLNPDSDIATIKEYIDTCVANNGWLLLGTHIYDWTDEQINNLFNAVVDYGIEKGCKFMTLGQALRKRMPIYNYYETYYKMWVT